MCAVPSHEFHCVRCSTAVRTLDNEEFSTYAEVRTPQYASIFYNSVKSGARQRCSKHRSPKYVRRSTAVRTLDNEELSTYAEVRTPQCALQTHASQLQAQLYVSVRARPVDEIVTIRGARV